MHVCSFLIILNIREKTIIKYWCIDYMGQDDSFVYRIISYEIFKLLPLPSRQLRKNIWE